MDKVLKKHGNVLCSNPQRELRKWKNSNPQVPRLYGYAKTHKLTDLNNPDGLKMRPVASNIDAPTEKIAKWLVKEFKKLKPPKGKSVKNAIEFMKLVKGVEVKRTETMGSYDVVSLFPSIPMDKTMILLRKWLIENGVSEARNEMYVEFTELCMKQNIFQYKNEFYIQRDGAAIGNSLSSFLAELYMCAFETEMEKHPLFPRVYSRFVDDIFAVQNARKVKDTLELFNSQHPRVQFTYEPERDGKISFLDTMVTKTNGKLEFDVFRKPCSTKRVITNDSNQDVKHKMAAFHSMAHRLVSFQLNDQAYKKERETILEIGRLNGYKSGTIERIIKKHERKKSLSEFSTFYSLPSKTEEEEPARVSMVYCPKITNALRPIYKENNVQLVHRSVSSLRQKLGSAKDKVPDLRKSGIYQIDCEEGCEYRYIGRTLRWPEVRFREHMDDWIKDEMDGSAVAAHLLKKDHEITIDNLSLLRPYSDKYKIDYMEAVYINKQKGKPLMNKIFGITSPLLTLVEPDNEKNEGTKSA